MCISPENNGHPRGHREKSDRSYRADQWMRNQCVQTVLCAGTAAGQTGKHEKRISVGRYLMQFQSGIGCNTRLTGGKEENYFDPPNAVRSQMWTIFRSLIQKINELRKSLTLFVVFFFLSSSFYFPFAAALYVRVWWSLQRIYCYTAYKCFQYMLLLIGPAEKIKCGRW